MANYTIIGGDKKEYGPVTSEDIRQWIAEGRLDGNTQARSENDTEWRPLATFPEFSLLLHARPQSPPPLRNLRKSVPVSAAADMKSPAIGLIVIGSLGTALALYDAIQDLFFPESLEKALAEVSPTLQSFFPGIQKSLNDPQMQSVLHTASSTWVRLGSDLFALLMSVLIVVGATRMLALRNYEFAFAAAILAVLPCLTPCPCCLLSLPFGIWALNVLRKPGVKDLFN